MMPVISAIVCSRKDALFNIHELNLRKTIGNVAFEYIRIDNRNKQYSLCSAYNKGVSLSHGKIIVFIHEDVFFMEGEWGEKLVAKFEDTSIGLVGVAGTEYLFADNPGWVVAGRPYIHGHVIHELENGRIYNLTVFSWDRRDVDVVAVDGLFFAVRKELFGKIRFDEKTFDGFHFYDIDLCMQIRRTHRCIVTWDILVKHLSAGSFDERWKMYALRFIEKYRDELPASCADTIPDLSRRIGFETFNLKGRAPQLTIV